MKRDKLIMVIIFAFVLIMTACGKRNDSKVGDEKNNSEADLVYIDYADAESFEAALNEGEDLEGKIVQFEALELHPDSAVGYNVWAGEHLNFISSSNPDIEVGEIVVVKCKAITSSLGSWFIKYEELYDRCIMCHTTFIPYREFERVLGIVGIDDFIRYGGTMSLGGKDTEFRYGTITGKYVIYRGATTSLVKAGVETQEDVAYLNVEEYLKAL